MIKDTIKRLRETIGQSNTGTFAAVLPGRADETDRQCTHCAENPV